MITIRRKWVAIGTVLKKPLKDVCDCTRSLDKLDRQIANTINQQKEVGEQIEILKTSFIDFSKSRIEREVRN